MLTNSSHTRHRNFAKTFLLPAMILVFGGLAWTSSDLDCQNQATIQEARKADRTYQVQWATTSRMKVEDRSTYTPFPLAAAVKAEVEGLETVAQVQLFGRGFLQTENEPSVRLDEIVFASPELLDIFEFKTITGNVGQTLTQPNQIALAESTAKKLFGTTNPLGKTININHSLTLQVTSVFADPTSATYATAQALISFVSLHDGILGDFPMDSWTEERKSQVYVVLEENQTVEPIHIQLQQIAQTHIQKDTHLSADHTFILKSFKDIYQTPNTLFNRFAMK